MIHFILCSNNCFIFIIGKELDCTYTCSGKVRKSLVGRLGIEKTGCAIKVTLCF